MLAQYDEDRRKERAIYYYYLSKNKKMTDYETWYTNLEKTCLALGNAEIEALHAVLPGTFTRMDPQKKVFVRETRLSGKDRKMVTASV